MSFLARVVLFYEAGSMEGRDTGMKEPIVLAQSVA